MEADRRAVLAILNDAKKKAYQHKQTVDWKAVEREWKEYFEQFSGEQWRNEFMPLFEGVAEDQAENWSGAFGIQFDIRNPLVQSFINDYAMRFSEPILDTTQENLKEMLRQADVNGWSIDDMVKQIDLTWERYLDPNFTLDGRRLTDDELQWFIDRSPRYRKSLIARDQSMRVSNASSFALFTGFGAPMKEWLHSGDDRVRPEHRQTGNAYIEGGAIGPIPIDEPFQVPPGSNNLMMYPGDSSLGAPIHLFISDRCTVLPFLPEEVLAEREAVPTDAEVAREEIRRASSSIRLELDAVKAELAKSYADGKALLAHISAMHEQGMSEEDQEPFWEQSDTLAEKSWELRTKRDELEKAFLSRLREPLYVDNPAKFMRKFSRRAKHAADWQEGLDEFSFLVGIGSLDGEEVTIRAGRQNRSFYLGTDTVIMSGTSRVKTVVHELGHWLEDKDADVHKKAVAFLDRRTIGEQAMWLGDSYAPDEITKRDKFVHPYMGKVYKDSKVTEIVSMGMELMWADPVDFATKDPEYFDFMYDLLRGN